MRVSASRMEGFKIKNGSRLMGKLLKDAPIRKDIGSTMKILSKS
jgi:hypothetical protein